ncbi:hypothetical protein ACSBR2_001838 [Camellia fascicularis]
MTLTFLYKNFTVRGTKNIKRERALSLAFVSIVVGYGSITAIAHKHHLQSTIGALPRTAYDVSLTDDSWSKDVFHIISGNTSMSWERLDVGALVSHAFELESEAQALFYGAPAVITFRIPTKVALQVLSLDKSIPHRLHIRR